jgi:hypothetical protein
MNEAKIQFIGVTSDATKQTGMAWGLPVLPLNFRIQEWNRREHQ